jgi:hypothetical protein
MGPLVTMTLLMLESTGRMDRGPGRVAFRDRYYTPVETIDADLQAFLCFCQAFLRFCNFERPHRGYRTKGRTPARIFFSGQPEILQQMGACDDDQRAT